MKILTHLVLYYVFYFQALAAHADAAMNKFEPEVSFFCHKPAMHRVVNGWEPDFTTDCLEDPAEILEYCKKVGILNMSKKVF
jgi:hypothetical protein